LYQRLAEKASDHEARAQETVWFSSSCDTEMRQFSVNPKDKILTATCIGAILNRATSTLFGCPLRILRFKIMPLAPNE
jgi:hypothetical protein